MDERTEFDLAIHLAGKEMLPNLIGMRDLKAKRHLLLTSADTDSTFDKLSRVARSEGIVLERFLLNDAFDINAIFNIASKSCSTAAKVAVNLTGGTKPMAFGAWIGAGRSDSDPRYFYYDTQNKRRLTWTNKSGVSFDKIGVRLTIDDFARLFDYPMEENDPNAIQKIKNRAAITRKMWDYRYAFAATTGDCEKTLQAYAAQFKDKPKPFEATAVNEHYGRATSASIKFDGRRGYIGFDGKLETGFGDDFPGYIGGGWFEERVYLVLEELLREGALTDIRPNVKVNFESREGAAQEFDALATDGLRLFIVECKAGDVDQKDVDKLENVTRKFGGVQGLGVLVTRVNLTTTNYHKNAIAKERAEKSPEFATFCGDKCLEELKARLLTAKKGEIYPQAMRK